MDKVDVTLPSIANSFFERFNDHVGGVVLNADIVVFEDINACDPYPSPTSTPINITPTPTNTPTSTLTPTPSITPTLTPTSTTSPTPTPSSTTSPTPTPTLTPTSTTSPTPTPSITPTHTPTPSITPTQTITPTPTLTPTSTITPTPTPSSLPPISSTFITNASSSSDQTTYNFTINSLTTDLYALVIHNEGFSASGRLVSSATLGGESITIVDQITGFEVAVGVAITYIRPSTSGNKTLSITFSDSCRNAAYGLWRIDNATSDTPIQSQKAPNISITFTGLSANNVGILGNSRALYNSTATWTNATERYDVDTHPGFTGGMRAVGADFITTVSGDRTVTVNASSQSQNIIGAVWS